MDLAQHLQELENKLQEGGTNYKQWEKEQVAAGKPAGDWNAYNAWKDQKMWGDYETNVTPNAQKEKGPSSSLDEAWWDWNKPNDTVKADGGELPLINTIHVDSPKGQELDKEVNQWNNNKTPNTRWERPNTRWADTPEPDDIPDKYKGGWLGDLEMEIDPVDDIKKLAGVKEPTSAPEEYNKDWYWHDSEGKVVRDTWGDPVKSGSHPDNQKKQPWDFFSDDIDRDTKMDQLDEAWWEDDSLYNAEVNKLRHKETSDKDEVKKAGGHINRAVDQVTAKGYGKEGDSWHQRQTAQDKARNPNSYDLKGRKTQLNPYTGKPNVQWGEKRPETKQGATNRRRQEAKSKAYKDEVKKAGGHINRAVDQVTAKGYGKEGDSWHQRQTAQDKARNPKSYDSKGRKTQLNPYTGKPNVQWGEKRPETTQGATNRKRQEAKTKSYNDKVKKAGGHLNKFGQDVKNMFSGDSYTKAKAAHKKKLADRKKLSKHEQNMAQLRDQGIF